MNTDAESDLARLVESEAKRRQWEDHISADPARTEAGWTRRFVVDARRCDEMVQLYSDLGFEVVADPILADALADECDDCQLLAMLRFRTIYTRPALG